MNVTEPLNLSDKALKFIQDNFNVNNDLNLNDVIQSLESLANNTYINNNRTLNSGLDKLISTKKDIMILDDKVLDMEIGRIVQSIHSGDKTVQTGRVIDDFIRDVAKMNAWLNDFDSYLNQIIANKPYSLKFLVAVGQSILTRAVSLAPIDTGALRSSGTLSVYSDYIIISFNVPYATYVHEDLGKAHATGRAKFLEIALQEHFPYRSVWVETHGESVVWCKIGILHDVTYRHYM